MVPVPPHPKLLLPAVDTWMMKHDIQLNNLNTQQKIKINNLTTLINQDV